MMERRAFLTSAAAAALVGCTGGPDAAVRTGQDQSVSTSGGNDSSTTVTTEAPVVVEPLAAPEVDLPLDAFALGVASGDPDHESVVLWTRLLGELPASVELLWEMAYDEAFTSLAATGIVSVADGFAHTAHQIVSGLPAATRFFYRFRTSNLTSSVGRTLTMAAPGTSPERLRLGVSSCQRMETGYWAGHADLAIADVDMVVWLGDFIYGEPTSSTLDGRAPAGGDPTDLGAYRQRYAQYRSDPNLQACSVAHPWIATWDDHEVANDYDSSVDPARRAAAYQAWWEHMPTRLTAPGLEGFDVYRSIDAGDLCRISLIDVRQHASPETLLGDAQRTWLGEQLNDTGAAVPTWTLLASPVLVGGLVTPTESEPLLPYTFDGYPAERAWLAEQLGQRPNRLALSGDLHAAAALTVSADPADPALVQVATEFMAPPMSSVFPADYAGFLPLIPLTNGHIDYIDAVNGWLLLDITTATTTAEFYLVDDVRNPTSGVSEGPRFEVRSGDPTPRRI